MSHKYESSFEKFQSLRDRSTDALDTAWRERRAKWKAQLKTIPPLRRERKKLHKQWQRTHGKEGKYDYGVSDLLRGAYLGYAWLRYQPLETVEQKVREGYWWTGHIEDAIKFLEAEGLEAKIRG